MRTNSVKTIIIRLGKGTIEDGFNHVNIKLSARSDEWEDSSNLPPNPELQQLLNQWQLLYPAAIELLSPGGNLSPQGVFDEDTITNVSSQDMAELNYNFRVTINDWLNFGDFGKIGRRLRKDLDTNDRILVIIVIEELGIWQLPWHFWDLFDDYPHAVEVFAKPKFTNVKHIKPQCRGKVNILALLGRDPKSKLDLSFLLKLTQSNSIIEDQATSAVKISERLRQVKPSILIFYGHGDTIERQSFRDGVIYLDNDNPLEISRLRIEIQAAVDRGLQIAIFNCCNGLGLAEQLADLNIPYIIVMREVIPNQIAQAFLENLFTAYSKGESFPAAFQFARQQLRLEAGGFAQFADWLPILFHNPLSDSVTWQDLAESVFSRMIPPRIVTICRDLSQPKRRIWTNVGLGLLGAISALSLQFQIQIVDWENQIVDRLQSTQVEKTLLSPSQVTIVNYHPVNVLGQVSGDTEQRETIDLVEKETKPTAWVINLENGESSILNHPNVIQGCVDEHSNNSSYKNRLQLDQCDLDPINSALGRANLGKLVASQDLRLNLNLQNKIDRIDRDTIATLSKSEIAKLFNGKIILVGNFDVEEMNSLAREAMAIDQITRANQAQARLPLFMYRSIGEQFIWVFAWSIFAGILSWRSKWKIVVLATIFGEIVISSGLFILWQGLPIMLTPIIMISVGGVVRMIITASRKNIDRQLGSLD
jgi:hypothetical protein